MRNVIEINNLTKKRIDPDYVKKVVRKTVKLSRLNSARQAGANPDIFELSVVFVGDAEMRGINRKYKKKDKSTDVLSFRYNLGYNKRSKKLGTDIIEGEIILCPDAIAKNAREKKVNFSRELVFVLAHGVLHVLGWRHSKKMYELQDKVSMICHG